MNSAELGVGTSLARIHCRALLHESVQPPKHALPTFGVARRGCWSTGKPLLTYSHQCARTSLPRATGMEAVDIGGLQFPTHDGFERAAIAADLGMDEQARWIDLQVFALDAKSRAVGSDANA